MTTFAGATLLWAWAAILTLPHVRAPAPHAHAPSPAPAQGRSGPEIRGPAAPHSRVPTPAFDTQGRLWVVWVEGGRIWISASEDRGGTFRSATPVSAEPAEIDDNGEGRPKLAFGPRGEIYVTWTRRLSKPYTGEILFTRSSDGGRSFSPPLAVNDDRTETGHRFDALAVAADGHVAVLWIDKRDRDRAARKGVKLPGASLYGAWSVDGGSSFGPNLRIEETACECCRVAVAPERDGRIAVFFRDIFPEQVRDHAVVRLGPRGAEGLLRATFDDWQIDGCPHHGPALAVDFDGAWHLAWWTAKGRMGGGVFYARKASGQGPSAPRRIGTDRAAHPALAATGRKVVLAWLDYPKGEGARVWASVSRDGGRTWSKARTLLETPGASDHPQLAVRGSEIALTWFTEKEGFRVIPALGEDQVARARSNST